MTRVQRAIRYAEETVIRMAPELADPEVRKRMSRTDKLLLINLLLELADEDLSRVEPLETV